MSADFLSIIAWLKPPMARRVAATCDGAELLEDVVDATGSAVHDFRRHGETISLRACAKEMKGQGPPKSEFATAWVKGIPNFDFDRRSVAVCTSNFPMVTVIDRVVAIPHGVPFLLGHAFRRMRPKALARAEAGWKVLLDAAGGERALAARLGPYVDRGGVGAEEARETIRGVTHGFSRARTLERDLVIVGCLASKLLEPCRDA